MPTLLNFTPFTAATFSLLDSQARQFDIVVASATYEARPGQRCRVSDQQTPVRDSDVFYGKAGFSSVLYEGEIAFEKPSVDIVVNGSAIAPRGRRVGTIHVGLSVAGIRKELQVSGDRHWRQGFLGQIASSPEPFDRLPIVYERAFGGGTCDRCDARNPFGIGFHGALSGNPNIKSEIPNVEYPARLIGSPREIPEPAGFRILGRNCQPRAAHAGTYDDTWLSQRWPLLPLDFDVRHFQVAPLDQQVSRLVGGEAVSIINMTEDGHWGFELPIPDLPLRLWPPEGGETQLRVDTLIIEPDHYRFTLIARAKIPILRNRPPLEELILGPMTPGRWHARLRGKKYMNWAPTSGPESRAGAVQL